MHSPCPRIARRHILAQQPLLSASFHNSLHPVDMVEAAWTALHLQDSLRDTLDAPLSWNDWQHTYAALARSFATTTTTTVHAWRVAMHHRFGPHWLDRCTHPPADCVHRAAQLHAVRYPVPNSPALDTARNLLLRHLQQPLPWNLWQHLLARLRRRFPVQPAPAPLYQDYLHDMSATFGAAWLSSLPRRGRDTRFAAARTYRACLASLPPPAAPQRLLQRRPRCNGRRLHALLLQLRDSLAALPPDAPLPASQLTRLQSLAFRASRCLTRRARRPVASTSVRNLRPGP